ncbi:MAG: hypothetical protein WAV47_00835 [Blastocatellia bacterium]
MPTPTTPTLPNQNSAQQPGHERDNQRTGNRSRLAASLGNHALAGGAAALLLSLVELIDLNVRLTHVFQPFIDRSVFCAYFSLNVAGGLMIGLAVGLFANAIRHCRSQHLRRRGRASWNTSQEKRGKKTPSTLILKRS